MFPVHDGPCALALSPDQRPQSRSPGLKMGCLALLRRPFLCLAPFRVVGLFDGRAWHDVRACLGRYMNACVCVLLDGWMCSRINARALPHRRGNCGAGVTVEDMAVVDPEYYKSMTYVLENDPSLLGVTFSVDEQVHLMRDIPPASSLFHGVYPPSLSVHILFGFLFFFPAS